MNYLIPEQLRDELIRYLMLRPCGEVMNAVIALRSLDQQPMNPCDVVEERQG